MSSSGPPNPIAPAHATVLTGTPMSVQPQPKPPPPPQQPSGSAAPPPSQQPQPQHQQQQQQQGPPPASLQQRPRICFNAHCKDPKSEGQRRRGWRLRSGDYAELCDRCYGSFEHGTFCETFHSEVAGWRKCEACGKRLHCGCIVSVHAYALLDAGGVDCILCARKSYAAMAPSQMWSTPTVHMPQNVADRKDSYVKSWRPPTGQISSQWRQNHQLWNMSTIQADLQQRLAYEFDRPSGSEKLPPGRTFIHAQEKKSDDMHDRPTTPAGMGQIIRDRYANGLGQQTSMDPTHSSTPYQREGPNPNSLHDPSHHVGESDPLSSRKGIISDGGSTVSTGFKLDSHHPSILKDDAASTLPTMGGYTITNYPPVPGRSDHLRIIPNNPQQPPTTVPLSVVQKQFYSHSVIEPNYQAQFRNGKPRMDPKARSELLPRYWPRITDKELQHLSGEYPKNSTSNSVITPLFEKMLSASDAGRIGRLVLPKKCAEAYFPPISQPEGLPLKVQDASGKEWVFQFRFWPNNNSRMYVLEGVTPCIQSMHLQAGDTVSFSRIDPEGKLVMGFRKTKTQEQIFRQEEPTKPANAAPNLPDVNINVTAPDSSPNSSLVRPNKVNTENKDSSPVEQAASKIDKGGVAQKEGPGTVRTSPGPVKRKATSIGPKIKRFRIDNEESMELKITWEEAQELLRPPLKAPSVVIVDGHEFEEYEEPPVLGRKTYFVTDQSGENHQWAQCEDCSKWRKLPIDALLPSKWTCSDNKWDPERMTCVSPQEASMEELAELIPIKAGAAKKAKLRMDTDSIDVSDGLDTLANLAILGEGESLPSQPTTKHPRHRPGCSCIVCIQPPSGKGPKHKQTCTCNVCMTVRRRFRTLMLRREKRASEKESEEPPRKKEQGQSSESPQDPLLASTSPTSTPQKVNGNGDDAEEAVEHSMASSPMKNQIDLNIQPEREDEQSPKSDAVGAMRLPRENAA
ncbi:B3 domain-containing protein Os07g0563300 isoform X1 [Aegilops tauschii subsp. strangulata]|nr:B3 domain-containing protein Os07g0563300 isoform X1 [Aegilops tauschii subsp. strangulata]